MLEQLKEEVYAANMMLKEHNLVILTWGNVSEVDKNREFIVIKPSGVDYEKMTPNDMVVVDLDGNVVEGRLNPSSDTPTHIELYKAFEETGGVCHTHSMYATVFAQSCHNAYGIDGIEAYGTTHADYFDGTIPCTRPMKKKEIEQDYEKNTGLVIVETLNKVKKSPSDMPAVLVCSHGPFTFGKNAKDSVHNSVILESVAELAYKTRILGTTAKTFLDRMQTELLRKHFDRKHGANAYYGQKDKL